MARKGRKEPVSCLTNTTCGPKNNIIVKVAKIFRPKHPSFEPKKDGQMKEMKAAEDGYKDVYHFIEAPVLLGKYWF